MEMNFTLTITETIVWEYEVKLRTNFHEIRSFTNTDKARLILWAFSV